MKDDSLDVLCLSHQLVDLPREFARWPVLAFEDVPPRVIVVPDINDEVVFRGDLITFDDRCEFLSARSLSV